MVAEQPLVRTEHMTDIPALKLLREQTKNLYAAVFKAHPHSINRLMRMKSAAILDHAFFELLSGLRIDSVMECGAHEASASVRFLQRGGRFALAVEANPKVYELRTLKATQHGVKVVNVGVSSEAGELDFHIPATAPMAGSSSFLEKKNREGKPSRVKVTTIDALMAEHFDTQHFGMWIDVEGYAFQVLSGGRQTLAQAPCKILKIELEDMEFWKDQATAFDVDELLAGFGLVPIMCDLEYAQQYNVIYVRVELAEQARTIIAPFVKELEGMDPESFRPEAEAWEQQQALRKQA